MKLTFGLLLSTLTLGAFSQLQPSAIACNSNIRSCSASNIDTCCSPKQGLSVLALQWYPGLGPADAFSLHGLWPNNCDGSFTPTNGCDAARQYTDLGSIVDQDPQLRSEMDTYWASYKGNNPDFWRHEWGKHGTCQSTVEPRCYDNFQPGQDVRDYFKQALALRTKFNLYSILKSANIVPGRTYPKADFISALNTLGAKAQLVCSGKAISEVRLYFYVNGKDDFVITNSLKGDGCPNNINYPVKY